jgi:endonuclease/exonuclease/phosphatase family metal-dependent hydrolase
MVEHPDEGAMREPEPQEDAPIGTGGVYASQALVAVLVVVVAQVGRVLFPIMFEIGEDWDFVAAGLVAVGVFAAPILALLFPRLSARSGALLGSLAMSMSLLVLRGLDPIPAVAAVVGVAAVLAGATIILTSVMSARRIGAVVLLSGLIVGLALDAGIRGVFGSWNLAWQRGIGSLLVTLVLAIVLVWLTVVVTGTAHDGLNSGARPLVALAVGAYLMLQLLFFHNFAFVGSQAGISMAAATLVVLIGSMGALAAIYASARAQLSRRAVMVLAGVCAVLAWVLPGVGGLASVLVVLAAQVTLTGLLAVAVDDQAQSTQQLSRTRRVVAVAGGSVLFLVLVLLWQIYIDQPLPIPRQALPAVAVLIVAWFARRGAQEGGAPSVGLLVPAAAVVTGVALVIPISLWITRPSPTTTDAETGEIRLVNYNVRGAVAIDGRLSPDDIAAEIASSDPDIVVLEEVARGWAIHGTMDLLAHLERELDMTSVYVPAADRQFGNAILSRLPMTEIAAETLPRDGTQDRSYVWVAIETPTGEINVVGTHTQTRSTAQITALLDAVGTATPLVLAGDLNVHPDDPEITLFTDAGLIDVVGSTGDPCQTTSSEPTSDCDRPDWVFITPDIGIDDVRIGTARVSDHLAIHVTLRHSDRSTPIP